VVCIALNFQGGQLIFTLEEWSLTRIFSAKFKPSLYAGISVGVNLATPAESIENNRVFGGSYADGVGGGAGATGFESAKGLGPVRPYAHGTVGAEWNVTGGFDQSWDVNMLIARIWDKVF
jgi:hypothetical protein